MIFKVYCVDIAGKYEEKLTKQCLKKEFSYLMNLRQMALVSLSNGSHLKMCFCPCFSLLKFYLTTQLWRI